MTATVLVRRSDPRSEWVLRGRDVTATMSGQVAKAHSGYRHEALIYRGLPGFLDAVVPFVRDGVDRGQPVMVAVVEPRLVALRRALGADAERVQFVDMADLGKNPARIIPAWRDFLESHDGPLRGVGEPIWAGRRQAEIEECQFHEALLNLAITPDSPLWLLCPYDAGALPPDVVDEAHRSHPAYISEDVYRGSTAYGGAFHVGAIFGRELPAPVGPVRNLVVSGDDGPLVVDWVRRWAEGSGLSAARSRKLASAMREITQDCVHQPGRSEVLQLWQEGSALICQIHDATHVQDPMIGRRPDGQEDTRGDVLRRANEKCDLVQVRSGAAGTTIRVHTWL